MSNVIVGLLHVCLSSPDVRSAISSYHGAGESKIIHTIVPKGLSSLPLLFV